jgi:hypothetical protein
MSIVLPKGILWYSAAATILLLLGVIAIGRYGLNMPTFIDKVFLKMNDSDVIDKRAKRLYVCSEKDLIVAARDPKEHARLAREEDVSVEVLEEKETAHMQAHVKDQERYWGAVARLWESAK